MSIKQNCDFCFSTRLEPVYTPINSRRGMEVFLCGECGLVQSFPTVAYQSRPPGSMSADADRSSYRYTKDVLSERYEECFSKHVDFAKCTHVLDVGSNRGAFVNYLEERHPGRIITGVEPDPDVTAGYDQLPNVTVQHCRIEHAVLPSDHFDFAYCAHTLEHADSARGMMLSVRRALKLGGLFFIAVPNLIFHRDLIEELFIDPHTFHFTFALLRDFASQTGFDVVFEGGPADADLVLLLRKNAAAEADLVFKPRHPALPGAMRAAIARYKGDIVDNREALRESARKLNAASATHKVVIWGGGRIFDALVRFGGLELAKVHLVVDKYLHRYVDSLHGVPLASPEVLREDESGSLLVYIASRDYAREIKAEAMALGVTQFVEFGEAARHAGK